MFFTRLARIYLIYSCSRIIEEQCRWMKDHPFDRPTQKMNTKIMALRQNLIGYAKGASQLFPLEGYYSSQLQRKIDLMFTQISEGLYGQNIEALREEGSEQSKKEIVDFYQTLEDWNLKLSLNIFRDRNYTHSNGQLATLGSFFDSTAPIFHGTSDHDHQKDVDSYYDRKETATRARWDSLIDLLKLLSVALLSALLLCILENDEITLYEGCGDIHFLGN